MDTNLSHFVKYPQLGNGLAPSTDLAAGDVIIRINEPYLVVAEKAALDIVCSQCLRESSSPLKRCSGCKTVQYCSTKCQSLAWKSDHKIVCPIYKNLPAFPPTPVRGLMSLLIRKEIGSGWLGTASNPTLTGLESHTVSLKKSSRWGEILLQAKAAVEFTGSNANSTEAVIDVLCLMATNAFRVTLPDNSPIGLCFEPIIALANHSCTPNATIMFDGRKIELRALDDIKENEQIFISYIDAKQSKKTRKEELSTRYFFDCQCAKCTEDDSPYATFIKASPSRYTKLDSFVDPKAMAEYAKAQVDRTFQAPSPPIQRLIQQLIDQSKASASPAQRLKLLKSAISQLPPHNLAIAPYPGLMHDLYLAYLDASLFTPALILLLFIYLNCDAYIYPQPHHPIRVIRLYTIARLLKQVASLQGTELSQGIEEYPTASARLNAIDFISAVQVLLIVVRSLGALSHGASSTFLTSVNEELAEVEEVQRQRGNVGERLKEWSADDDVEGQEYARKIFSDLRALGGFGMNICHEVGGATPDDALEVMATRLSL